MPPVRFPKNPGKSRNPKQTIKRLLGYISSTSKMVLPVVFICIVISSVVGVLGSLFIQVLIDNYIEPLTQMADPDFSGLLKACAIMAAIYLAGILSTFIYNRAMVVVSQSVLKRIRDEMFAKMQTLPLRYFDTHTHGDIMSHYTNDTDTLRQMISQSLPQMLSSCLTIIAVAAAMLYLSGWLTLVVLVFLVLMLFVVKKVGGNSAKYFISQQKALGKVNGYIEEMINGQKVIKVFCHEEAAKEGFDELNEELCSHASAANIFANILMPIMANLGHVQFVTIAIVGGILALHGIGGLTLGTIASFLLLSRSFTMPISQVSQQINSVAMALAGAERIFDLMDEEPEADDGYVTLVNAKYENGVLTETEERSGLWAWRHPHHDGSISYTELKGDVRLFDVDFAYQPDKPVLHNISLYAKPGQKVAFVGATGAGKTTITNLINRFYDIADGKIRYDGININKIKKPDLRRSLGVVLQDTHLFTDTLRANIRYGRLDATDEEVYAAARLANADNFIRRLPNGYDTVISGDGGSLSQGQRQLISIARAAVANPPVMILDEATSSIDTRTEAIVQRGMDSLMEGRTVFVIAHRLSTVHNAKAIMVLEQGRIIERGDHRQLIEQKGKYYQLYTGAFELE